MPIPREVVVLGTTYSVDVKELDKRFKDYGGYIDVTSKKIVIQDRKYYVPESEDIIPFDNPDECIKKVFRHELIHGLFYESGLEEYYNDERLVDFLAIQLPKIKKYI